MAYRLNEVNEIGDGFVILTLGLEIQFGRLKNEQVGDHVYEEEGQRGSFRHLDWD